MLPHQHPVPFRPHPEFTPEMFVFCVLSEIYHFFMILSDIGDLIFTEVFGNFRFHRHCALSSLFTEADG
jgi:hypothetical protein